MRKNIPKGCELSHLCSYLSRNVNCAGFEPDSVGCDLFSGRGHNVLQVRHAHSHLVGSEIVSFVLLWLLISLWHLL